MTGKSSAAGRKTDLVGVSSRLQSLIEDQVASLSQGVADCLDRARTREPRGSLDDSRSSEHRDAVGFVSATAELLGAIAKLKGEFNQNYRVTHVAEPAETAASAADDEPELLTPEEIDALSDEEYAAGLLASPPPRPKRGSNG